MTLLSQDDYLATMGQTREVLQPEDAGQVALGQYVKGIGKSDVQGFDFSAGLVANAWSIDHGIWQHVLLAADVPDVFLVIVLNGRSSQVHGHHVLDLNGLYGLTD